MIKFMQHDSLRKLELSNIKGVIQYSFLHFHNFTNPKWMSNF